MASDCIGHYNVTDEKTMGIIECFPNRFIAMESAGIMTKSCFDDVPKLLAVCFNLICKLY